MGKIKIGLRLKELRNSLGFSQTYVAGKLFISQGAYSLIEHGSNSLGSEHLLRLSELYNVTADYILTGEKKLINMTYENGFLPLIHAKAHAGFLKNSQLEEVMDEFEYYKIPGYNPTKDSMLIEIEGDSMLPAIVSGDVVICQIQKNMDHVIDGSVAILVTRNELMATRLYTHSNEKYFLLKSDNPGENDKKDIKKSEIVQLLMVMGKVSKILVPHRELSFRRRIGDLEDSVESLSKQLFKMEKLLSKKK